MEVMIPKSGDAFCPSWSRRCYTKEERVLVWPNPRNADFYPIKDILVSPEKDDRTVFERLRHVRLHDKHADAYFRDNPVIHIKYLDDFYTPRLYDLNTEVYDGQPMVLDGTDGKFLPVAAFPLPARSIQVFWPIGGDLGSFDRGLYVANLSYSSGHLTLDSYAPTRWKFVGTTLSGPQYVPTSEGRREMPSFSIGTIAEFGRIRDAVERHSLWRPITTPVYSDYDVEFRTLNLDMVDVPKILAQVEAAAYDAMQFNELELYAKSSKFEKHGYHHVPYPLQVALGEAWDNAVQPHGENPGLPTLGFNNLQNIAALIDGLLLLGLGKDSGLPDALGEMVHWKTSKEETYERLANIGKHSKYRMTHDPDWVNLTREQQRRLVRFSDISSVQNSVNASAVLADTTDWPDSWKRPGWQEVCDAWFGGRYVWSTSWSDAEQAYRYLQYKMQQALGQEDWHPTLHGRASISDSPSTVGAPVVRASFTCIERAVTGFAKFAKTLYDTGLAPTAAVMWDFIPFSFIVDWFFPVSNTLEAYSRSEYYAPMYYTYDNGICYSVKYRVTTRLGFDVQVYTRWYMAEPPEVSLGHMLIDGGKTPSAKTTAFRFTDGMLLLFRR